MLWTVVLVCFVTLVTSSRHPREIEEDTIFGVDRSVLKFNEQSRHFRILEMLRKINNEPDVTYYANDDDDISKVLFRGSISCDAKKFKVNEIEATSNGVPVESVTKMYKSYVITEDQGLDLETPRELSFRIKHTGCVPAERHCYGVTEFKYYFTPDDLKQKKIIDMNLLQNRYREECYGFFSRFIRMF